MVTEHAEGELSRGAIDPSLQTRLDRGGQALHAGQFGAVLRGKEDDGGERGERKIGGRECIRGEITAPVGEHVVDLLKHALDFFKRALCARGRDPHAPSHEQTREREKEGQGQTFGRRCAVLAELEDEIAIGQDVEVHPTSGMRAQVFVETIFEALDLASFRIVFPVQTDLRVAGAGPLEDFGGVVEDAVVGDEAGRGVFAPCAAYGGQVKDGQVAGFAVHDACTLEAPASLFAEVAERDRDEERGRHGAAVLTLLSSAVYPRAGMIVFMDNSSQFRRNLASRVASALGLSFVVTSGLAGCGGKVVVDVEGAGGAGGTASASTTTSDVTTTGPGSVTSSSTGIPACDPSQGSPYPFLSCFKLGGNVCPSAGDVAGNISATLDGCTCLLSVDDGPKPDPSGNGLCCYDTTLVTLCVVGRALPSEHGPVVAPIEAARRGWSEEDLTPKLEGLSEEERQALASRWIRDGLFEHASVASFSRLALFLLATSADAELVRAAHEAALDEVRHAKQSLSLAAAYRGEPIAPRALPLQDVAPMGMDLLDLAVSSVIEGAVGETLSAVLAAEQAAAAQDPVVARVLSAIAEDEARHAELAFRVVSFAIAAGGERVREASLQAFVEASSRLPEPPEDLAVSRDVAAAHGNLSSSEVRAVFVRAMDDIVMPLGRAICEA